MRHQVHEMMSKANFCSTRKVRVRRIRLYHPSRENPVKNFLVVKPPWPSRIRLHPPVRVNSYECLSNRRELLEGEGSPVSPIVASRFGVVLQRVTTETRLVPSGAPSANRQPLLAQIVRSTTCTAHNHKVLVTVGENKVFGGATSSHPISFDSWTKIFESGALHARDAQQ